MGAANQENDLYVEAAYRQIAFKLGLDISEVPPYLNDPDRAKIEGVAIKTIQHRRWAGRDNLPTIKRGRTRSTMTEALAQDMALQARGSVRS